MKNPFNFSPDIAGGESFEAYSLRCDKNKKSILAVLTLFISAVLLWLVVLMQGCQLQHADAVKFETYSQHAQKLDSEAQRILDELSAGKDQSEALSKDSLRLALSILDSLQDVVLDDIYFTANDTLGHLSR